MNNQNIQVVTHNDLDGVVSYLVLCWLYGKKLNVIPTTPSKLEKDIEKLYSNKITFEKLYFLDLDVSKIGNIIDHKNTIIIDHHKTNLFDFKNATTVIRNETSCAKLLFETFIKKTNKTITQSQKTLIALADDFDSNKNAIALSRQLNIVYHSMQNKFQSFVDDYFEGFYPFDKFKINTINLYFKHCKEYIQQLTPFTGTVEFEGQKNVKIGAIFCDKFVQECCDWVLLEHNVDVVIAVLMNQNRIAVRRHPNNSTIDVSSFVQRIANGGGHEAAAGGNLTEDFIEFTKMLKPV